MDPAHQSAALGLAVGLVLGLAARWGRFCTLGALEDALYGGADLRLRMWAVAIGVAVTGSGAAMAAGLIDPAQTLYLGQVWHPSASILGGLAFGYGMALAGNCGYGALARLGGGDLRSLVIVMVMGLTAYAVLSGPFAAARVALWPPAPAAQPPGLAHDLARRGAVPFWVLTTGIGIGAVMLALWPARMRAARGAVLWGGAVGLAVVAAWVGTGWIARAGFDATPVVAPTFASPLGETMIWVMTASGQPLSFNVGCVSGVVLGALAGSWRRGHFRWEACDDPRELGRQIAGAALMGAGGVVAAGCSIGQGLSALSLLAWSAPVTLAAIALGAAVGLRQMIGGAHGV